MRLLLDTHIFLWYVGGDQRVGDNLRQAIKDADAVYLSVVSVWEATIKYSIGKLPLPEPPHPWLSVQREQHGIESLPIDEASIAHLPDARAASSRSVRPHPGVPGHRTRPAARYG